MNEKVMVGSAHTWRYAVDSSSKHSPCADCREAAHSPLYQVISISPTLHATVPYAFKQFFDVHTWIPCIITSEDFMSAGNGVDSAAVIVRPDSCGGWQVEFPGTAGVSLAQARTKDEAIYLARCVMPNAAILLQSTSS
ncbi:hypothetical protein [Caballeronia sp. LZ035]|uniref:type II toxin-antitoxin system HicB family antitoxin n=1 Tax=Caballeronia sp. LZ035 TaxID=3038568 RepID=UPI0028586FAF|nr:hypothetical protein [Caballeronia sp. LZ035]MDR5763480.1 hypothetical protein [Caballeronia sp. LZ035]